MAAALFFLITGCLLQGAMFEEFGISVPDKMTVLRGSCMTIPCSFTVRDKYKADLDSPCQALWYQKGDIVVFHSGNPQVGQVHGTLTGDLKQKNCNTTLNNIQTQKNDDEYFFRLECGDEKGPLKYSFKERTIGITFKDNLPAPTLSPTSLTVAEGDSVTLTCSALAPCLSLPPTLTWTPSLGAGQDRWEEQSDKTQKKISVVTFTASHLHDGQTMTCTAVYKREDKKADSSVHSSLRAIVLYSPKGTTVSVSPPGPVKEDQTVTLTCNSKANPAVKNYTWYRADGGQETIIGTGRVLNTTVSKDKRAFLCKAQNDKGTGKSNITQLDVQFAPLILPSPGCTRTVDRINCSCETSGNPPPTSLWYLNEFPATEPMDYVIRHEATNGKVVSVISMNPANVERNVTLLCNSSNALGSASQRFYFYSQVTDSGDGLLLPVFITAIVALLVLVFALLCIIRALRTNQNLLKSQSSSTTSTIAMSQLLPSGEGKEKPKTTDEDIYVNSSELRQAYNAQPAQVPELYHINLPSSGEGLGKKAEESQDVIYTSVIWKNKSKEAEASGYMDPSGSTQFMNNAQEMGVVYNQVKPKSRKQEPESEYADVKFKDKNVTQH